MLVFSGNKRYTDSPHKARVGCAGNLLADVLLECAQYRVVEECATLDHDVVAEFFQVGNANYLGEYVFDDRAAKACHDVIGVLAVLLLGYDAAVHEHRAAASQIGGRFRFEGSAGNAFGGNVQRGCEALEERSAAGRACLVYYNIGDNAVVDPDRLHVLAANVQDE